MPLSSPFSGNILIHQRPAPDLIEFVVYCSTQFYGGGEAPLDPCNCLSICSFQFFDLNTMIHLPKSVWMVLLLIPILSICSIRRLNKLAPFALAANGLYICKPFLFVLNIRQILSNYKVHFYHLSKTFCSCRGHSIIFLFHTFEVVVRSPSRWSS